MLKKAGLKLTKPRITILQILEKSPTPLSAKDIHKKTKTIDLVSIYRSLKIFEEIKLVFGENLNGEKKYHLGKFHHHIICRICGLSKCLPCNHESPKISFFKKIKHQVNYSGLCNNCA